MSNFTPFKPISAAVSDVRAATSRPAGCRTAVRRARVPGPSSSRRGRCALCVVLALLMTLGGIGSVQAADEGREDLDKATDTKLNATTLTDLNDVIRLAESALKKGLDQANTEFANKLLASTLLQRARETTKQTLANAASPDDFRQKRDYAIADLERAAALEPKQAETYFLIAQLNLLPGGDPKKAREAVDKAIELGFDEPPAQAKALMLRATLQAEPEKKLADLDAAVQLAPEEAAVVRARGLLRGDTERLDAALADLNKAIELDPDDAQTYEAKAIVLARLKKFDEAMAALDKARQLNPDSVMPWVQRARVHSSQEMFDAALEDINQALTMAPGNVAVLLMRASIYQEKGDKEKALADVDRALTLKPDLPVAIRTRALLLADSQRFDEAIVELEKLRALQPKDALSLLQLAILYGAKKNPEKAIEAYSAVVALEPNDARALRGRGDLYLNLGRQAEAIADYENALKIEPKDFGVLNNLAWVLATSTDDKLRNGKRAIELATLACEVTEYKIGYILSTLAAAHAESGDFPTAIKWSTKAIELGEKEHAESLKKELESYQAGKPWRELLPEEKPNAPPEKAPPGAATQN